MPGKVNPTQCEALTMVCAQVDCQKPGLARIGCRAVSGQNHEVDALEFL
jgi:fumarate hydratase class II